MKKYRIIKEFPGSLSLGTIFNENDEYFDIVSKYPEFFEEVNGPDYLISQVLYATEVRTLFDGLYRIYQVGVGFELEYILDNGGEILSVIRLSDSEVFTVGDRIDFNGISKGKLLKIEFESAPVDKGTGKLCFVNDTNNLGKWWSINELTKIKDHIFTTEDGVDIYFGDRFWFTEKYGNRIFNTTAIDSSGKSPSSKYFSTEEAAENYVLKYKKFVM